MIVQPQQLYKELHCLPVCNKKDYHTRVKITMTTIQDLILEDLLATTPEFVQVTPIPYDLLQPIENQVLQTYRYMQRAIRMKNRILSLVYAYYLGELLEGIVNRSQQSYLNQHLTKYHLTGCRRTYSLFERSGIEQIWRTRHTTLTMITKLKFSEYQLLVNS